MAFILYNYLSDILIKLVVAIAIILLGLVFGRFIGNLTKRLLHELEINRVLSEQANVNIPLEEFVSSLVKYLVYLIAVITALSQIGLAGTIFYILVGLILATLLAFIILAVKDFIPNAISGFFLHKKNKFKIGDTIEVNNIKGKVTEMSLLETKIKVKSKDVVFIPNSLLTKSEVKILNEGSRKNSANKT